jgi:hypothetical protein
MTVRIRNDERAAIVAALESDEYDSPETAAKAIFELVAGLLAKRDSYCVKVDWASGVVLGPIWGDSRQAAKVASAAQVTFSATERAQNLGVAVLPLSSPAALLEEHSDGRPGICPDCEHPKPSHWDKAWVKPGGKVRQPRGCVVAGCGCKEVYLTRKGVWVSVRDKDAST